MSGRAAIQPVDGAFSAPEPGSARWADWLETQHELCREEIDGILVDMDNGMPETEAIDRARQLAAVRQGRDRLKTLDLIALSETPPQARQFAIERIAPRGEVTKLTGPGGSAKSLLLQQLCTAMAAGQDCLGLTINPGAALYLTCEDDANELHWRQASICRALNIEMASLADRLHLVSLRGELDNALTAPDERGETAPSATYNRIAAFVRLTSAAMVVLDNVAHLFDGNENDRGDVTRFVNLLNRLAGETGAAVVLIGHPNKAGDEFSGSNAWSNAVRSRAYLAHDVETDIRTLSLPKANYAAKGDVVRFRWVDGALWRDEDMPADTLREMDEAIRAGSENAAFLACLRARSLQGEGREVGPSPGPNYAPTQFEGMPQAKGLRKAALKDAMERLFTLGMIKTVTVDRAGKSATKTILREVPPNASPNASRTPRPNLPEPPPERPREHTIDTTYQSGAGRGPAAPDKHHG